MAAPVDVVVSYSDGTKEKFHQTPGIWQDHTEHAIVKITTKKKVDSIGLDGGIFMDADVTNNTWKGKAF